MQTYFMGIGGMAMGNVAILANCLGDKVLGSDTGFYPPLRATLGDATVFEGYSAQRLEKLDVDLVVIGNGIGRGNEELEWFWANKPCAYMSMPEFLRTRVIGSRPSIVITGTHGKTTTTAMTAFLLKSAGVNPGWMIGGVPQNLPAGANLGDPNAPFVIEGDEYDSAFFDKRAKFISYTPTVAVVNNLELDHTDIYRDLDDIKRSFRYMLRTVPANGVVIANADDANVRDILPVSWAPTIWVGTGSGADVEIRNFSEDEEGSSFALYYKGKFWTQITYALAGLYNARNAAAAVVAAAWTICRDNLTVFDPADMLKDFVGVNRRQQVRYNDGELLVIDDFAHHPTAIAQTLESLQKRYPRRKWIACFEPRSNTSRTQTHQQTLPQAFAKADVAILTPVWHAENLEAPLDLKKVALEIVHAKTELPESVQELPELIARHVKAGEPTAVVFFSNGNFSGQMDAYLDSLRVAVVA